MRNLVRCVGKEILATARVVVGRVIYAYFPELRNRLLAEWPTGGPQHGLQQWLFQDVLQSLMSEYYNPATISARRETLKNLCMGQQSGVAWADEYASRGFPDEFTSRLPLFRVLDEWLSTGKVLTVHQVACSSGREIAYYARRYSHIQFVGSDMDDIIVSSCEKRWKEIPNLSFMVLRLDRLCASEENSLRCDLVYASGGLHLLDEPTLRKFFRVLLPLTTKLMFTQPIAIAFIMDHHEHSTRRAEMSFSWNHPYTVYLRECGWRDVSYQVGFIEEHYWAKNVSVEATS